MTGMKGGLGRLEKILEEYREERSECLVRVQDIDGFIELITKAIARLRQAKGQEAGE